MTDFDKLTLDIELMEVLKSEMLSYAVELLKLHFDPYLRIRKQNGKSKSRS